MMKIYKAKKIASLFTGVCAVLAMSALPAIAEENNGNDGQDPSGLLNPKPLVIDSECAYAIRNISFVFGADVTVLENATARIVDAEGNDVTTTTDFKIQSENASNIVNVNFDNATPPKGASYTIVIDESSVALSDNMELTNNRLAWPIHVPSSLGQIQFDYPEDIRFADSKEITGSTAYVLCSIKDGAEWEILRNGKFLMNSPIMKKNVSDSEFCHLQFDAQMDPVRFEKDVEYTVVVPAGSVTGTGRPDIENEETRLTFKGSYDGSVGTMMFTECSIGEEEVPLELNDVAFFFDKKIKLTGDQTFKLYKLYVELKDAENTVSIVENDNNTWAVRADFNGYKLQKGETYTLQLPEAIVVTDDEDMEYNLPAYIKFKSSSSVSVIAGDSVFFTVSGNAVTVSGLNSGEAVTVYRLDGTVATAATATGSDLTLIVEGGNTYIVKAGADIRKIRF